MYPIFSFICNVPTVTAAKSRLYLPAICSQANKGGWSAEQEDIFGALDGGEKTTAILRDRRWPQAAKQGGDKIGKTSLCNT